MLTVSNTFKQAMHQSTKSLRSKVVILDNLEQVIADNDGLISFSIESTGFLFGTSISLAQIKLANTNYNLIGKDLSLKTAVKVNQANNTYEEIELGRFRVSEQIVDLEKNQTTIKALSATGIIAQTPYSTGELTFPCTVANLAEQIASKFGLATDLSGLQNITYEITEDLYGKIQNITYRDILSEIAGATGTMAVVKGDQLQFLPPNNTINQGWTYDHLKSIKFQPKYGPINALVLARTPQEDNIVARDETSIIANGLTDVKLANNEILDDNREPLIQPLFDAIKGFHFFPFEAHTEGHGYYECGDRINVSDNTNNWEIIVTDIKLEIGQGIKEVIRGVAPTTQQTDYARAGGILKTIFNTEIKVDKQNQEIKSVVEKTTELDDKIEANYTQITQNLTSITNTIQTTGGANLLHNSVGYATDTSRIPTIWTKTGNVIANTSPESLTFGAKSGSQIILSPSSSIAQTIVVAHHQPVSISARVKKGLIGRATISISTNNSDKRTIEINNNQEYLWQEIKLDNFIPELSDLTVKVETTNNATLTITDLMLNVGDKTIPWQQASGEIYNTNVIIDIDGMIIKNSVYAGDYMKFTPLEIANYSNASGTEKKTFWLNRDLTNVQKLQAVDQITMPPVKIIPITETNRAGWAFVADKGEN